MKMFSVLMNAPKLIIRVTVKQANELWLITFIEMDVCIHIFELDTAKSTLKNKIIENALEYSVYPAVLGIEWLAAFLALTFGFF